MPTAQELKKILKKYADGTSSPEENSLLEAWFSRIGDEQQTAEMNDADRRRMLAAFRQHPRFAPSHPAKLISLWPAWKKLAVAASILAFAALSCLWTYSYWKNKPEQAVWVTVQTGRGEVRKITLPDSSIVWLNARTSLRYDQNFRQHRFLRLDGEAVFTAKHDKSHPFTVQTPDGIETTDIGTQFNIRSYRKSAETMVAVLTGSVSIGRTKQPAQDTLLKNDAVSFNRHTQAFAKTREDAESAAGWRTGQWEIKGKGLDALALLLYNQYGISLQHSGKSLEKLELDANFNKKQKPEEIISTFCLLANCRYRWKSPESVELY